MTPYYKTQLERGLVYQDFIYEILSRHGINTVAYGSRLFQHKLGENKAGIEIKFDGNLHTGNLYIETEEKSNANNQFFVKSGIYRDCNEYVIGDYATVFRLGTNVLRICHETGKYRELEIRMGTSRGFLFPQKEAERLAIAVYRPDCSGAMSEIIKADKDGKAVAKEQMLELLTAMKCNPAQLALF